MIGECFAQSPSTGIYSTWQAATQDTAKRDTQDRLGFAGPGTAGHIAGDDLRLLFGFGGKLQLPSGNTDNPIDLDTDWARTHRNGLVLGNQRVCSLVLFLLLPFVGWDHSHDSSNSNPKD